jgi:site-specific recombinase XerD
MAAVYRKSYTMPLPPQAQLVEEFGQMLAKWTDNRGKKHTDRTTLGKRGQVKIVRYAPTYLAQYRDADDQIIIESTGCRDKQAALHVLAERVKRAEHIKAGILTSQQCRTADYAQDMLSVHIEAYLEYLHHKTIRGKRVSGGHIDNVRRQLTTLLNDCAFRRLQDITRDAMQKWMNRAEQAGKGARTRNTYRAGMIAFCNWCVQTDRLSANPLARLCCADEHADRRKTRRALTEAELNRLFTAARLRPLAEYGRDTVRLPKAQRQGHRTWHKEQLHFESLEVAAHRARLRLKDKPGLTDELEWTGRQRALMYKTLALTGLRRGELASITLGQVWLDVPQPYLELKAKNEKSGRACNIPLRRDLAAEIGRFVADKRQRLEGDKYRLARLPLFDMPDSLIGIFDRDLAAAGIAKQDERGRTLDVHALRHTFGTHLSLAGVAPRVAQAAMRHSTLNLTMNIYTDPTLLDVAGAINALPTFEATPSARTGA